MKVLFLDIDGVLNSTKTLCAFGSIPNTSQLKKAALINNAEVRPEFDPVAVNLIFRLCRLGDVKIVVSSAWRYSFALRDFIAMFEQCYNIADAADIVIGTTPQLWHQTRGEEIAAWVNDNDVSQFAIVDDVFDFAEEQRNSVVLTSFEEGFTFVHYKQLCELFAISDRTYTGIKSLLDNSD